MQFKSADELIAKEGSLWINARCQRYSLDHFTTILWIEFARWGVRRRNSMVVWRHQGRWKLCRFVAAVNTSVELRPNIDAPPQRKQLFNFDELRRIDNEKFNSNLVTNTLQVCLADDSFEDQEKQIFLYWFHVAKSPCQSWKKERISIVFGHWHNFNHEWQQL